MKKYEVWKFTTRSGEDYRIGIGHYDCGLAKNARQGSVFVGHITAQGHNEAVAKLLCGMGIGVKGILL